MNKVQEPVFRKEFVPTLAEQIATAMMRLRIDAGLTMRQLADRMNVPVRVVFRMESGISVPPWKLLEKAAEVFDVRWQLRAVPKEEE